MPFENNLWGIFCLLQCSLSGFPASAGTVEFSFEPANRSVQMVIWAEDDQGSFLGTITITDFIGRRGGGNRTDDTNIDSGEGNRLSALPVWAHKRNIIDTTFGIDNLYPPSQSKASYPEELDAVSKATPDDSPQTISWPTDDLPSGTIHFWLEANMSFDINEYHQYGFYRGQPSVLWECVLTIGSLPDTSRILDYLGYGAPDGSDGAIRPPDTTITTAAELLVNQNGARFQAIYTPSEEVGVEKTGNQHPESVRLLQNYPNPFNPETQIAYDLNEPSHIRLTVQNCSGQEVACLFDGMQSPGEHRLHFDGSHLPSGIYFCRMFIGEKEVQTRKLILLR